MWEKAHTSTVRVFQNRRMISTCGAVRSTHNIGCRIWKTVETKVPVSGKDWESSVFSLHLILATIDEGEVWDQHILRLRPYEELDAFEKMCSVKGWFGWNGVLVRISPQWTKWFGICSTHNGVPLRLSPQWTVKGGKGSIWWSESCFCLSFFVVPVRSENKQLGICSIHNEVPLRLSLQWAVVRGKMQKGTIWRVRVRPSEVRVSYVKRFGICSTQNGVPLQLSPQWIVASGARGLFAFRSLETLSAILNTYWVVEGNRKLVTCRILPIISAPDAVGSMHRLLTTHQRAFA